MELKEKVETLAKIISDLMQEIDMFTLGIKEEDFELLEKAKEGLREKISRNKSALALIYALGGEYDSLEDEMKLKTLELLIELIKTRVEFREKKAEQIKTARNRKEALKIFGMI